ncbi:hypothetical protein PYK79_24195, partial [Streptomyces sp. ID05-04B]|nr:hypothetical protein [Streptomyces sp. ID05-04B]
SPVIDKRMASEAIPVPCRSALVGRVGANPPNQGVRLLAGLDADGVLRWRDGALFPADVELRGKERFR